jgi:glycosyltransferase A (GT-A) superfamily protein (DUF2064 family)
MAKAPTPGAVKTRLCPPCTPEQAAAIAAAALADTFDAVAACSADRLMVALAGEPGPWLPPGFGVLPQRGHDLAERLTHAWAAAGGPGVQIAMDTPQVTAADLDAALATLEQPGTDAVLGLAADGGWWAIGLRRPWDVFRGVPMSTAATGAAQLARLRALGMNVRLLPTRRDVDTWADARSVARLIPRSRFARAVRAIEVAA